MFPFISYFFPTSTQTVAAGINQKEELLLVLFRTLSGVPGYLSVSASSEPSDMSDDDWEARSFPRIAVLVTISMLGFSVSQVDPTAPAIPFVGACFALPVLTSVAMMNSTPRMKQKVFSCFIAIVSILGMLHFLKMASDDFDLSKYPHRADKSMMMRMHKIGQIPPQVMVFTALPGLAAPAGMKASMVKKVSSFNFLILCGIIAAIYNNIRKSARSDDSFLYFPSDVIAVLAIFSYTLFACVPGAKITENNTELLKAGRHADSLLNHILKNQVAGAAAVLEIFIQSNPSAQSELQGACDQMYRSASWCANRQTMLDLAAGVYTSMLAPVDIPSFLEEIRSPAVSFNLNDKTQIATQSHFIKLEDISAEILFDKRMGLLALENLISNAVAHGDHSFPVEVTASLEGINEQSNECSVVIKVENRIQAGVKMTNAMLQKLDKSSSDPQKGVTAKTTIIRDSDTKNTSTNSGLKHVKLACKGSGGSFEMFMGLGNKSVISRLVFPAHRIERTAAVREHHAAAEAAAVQLGHVTPTPNLRVCCIDDTFMICKSYQKLLLPFMEADMQYSSVICPTTSRDVDSFLSDAIGVGDGGDNQQGDSKGGKPADVIILDQNIDILPGPTENFTIYGTDLALKLRNSGYKGLILLRSANYTEQDIATYMAGGAVDGCLAKDGNHRLVANQIFKAHSRKAVDELCQKRSY